MSRAWRPWIVLTSLSILILVLGHQIGERQGVLWAVVVALGLNAFFYFFSDLFLKPRFKGRKIEGRDPWHLNEVLEKLALKARIKAPGLTILPLESSQAFAIGRSWSSARIYLTEGLLRRLSEKEVEAILAFELALVKRLDIFSMAVSSTFAIGLFTITRTLDMFFRWLIGTKKPHSTYNHLFTSLFAPLIGLVIRLSLHEKDFLAADQLASSWTENPNSLAQALWKLHSLRQTQPLTTPASLSHLYVVNPLISRGWRRHLQIQPTVEARIKKLTGHYPV